MSQVVEDFILPLPHYGIPFIVVAGGINQACWRRFEVRRRSEGDSVVIRPFSLKETRAQIEMMVKGRPPGDWQIESLTSFAHWLSGGIPGISAVATESLLANDGDFSAMRQELEVDLGGLMEFAGLKYRIEALRLAFLSAAARTVGKPGFSTITAIKILNSEPRVISKLGADGLCPWDRQSACYRFYPGVEAALIAMAHFLYPDKTDKWVDEAARAIKLNFWRKGRFAWSIRRRVWRKK